MTAKAVTTRNRNEKSIAKLLDILSQTDEGKALVDFAKDKKIKFTLGSGATADTGCWMPSSNKVFLNKTLSTDQKLGILSHELRHAWQTHSIKNLAHVANRKVLKTKFKQSVMLLRHMEADAYSYQLATCMDLKNKGRIKSEPAKAFVALDQGQIRNFIKDFAKRHARQPFSAAARKESFLFFHQTWMLRELHDDMYIGMGRALPRRELTQGDFNYASIIGLPKVGRAFNHLAQSMISTNKVRFLSKDEERAAGKVAEKALHPDLKKWIGRINKRVGQALAKG